MQVAFLRGDYVVSNKFELNEEKNVNVEQPTHQRFFLVGILFVGIMIAFLDRVNVSVLGANEEFLTYMGISGQPVQIGLMMSIFLAAYGLANITLSPIGDYLGPRKTMVLCLGLMTASMFVGGFATSFTFFLVARVILGVGEGVYYPMQSLFIKNWIPPHERGRANATWVIGQSLAPAIAMPLFAYVVGQYGWRDSFYMCIVLGMIPLYLFWFHSTDKPSAHKKINAAELKYIEEGMAKESSIELSGPKQSIWERIKPFSTNYKYWILVYWYMSLQFIYWGLVSWLPAYLKTARGFSWAEMGWMASLPFVFAVVTKAIGGWLNDKLGKSGPILLSAMLFGSLSIYGAAVVTAKYPAALLIAAAFGFTTMATSSAWTLLQGLVPSGSLSTAAGTMNGISTGLSALSPLIIGTVIASTGSYDSGLITLVVVGAIAAGAGGFLTVKKL